MSKNKYQQLKNQYKNSKIRTYTRWSNGNIEEYEIFPSVRSCVHKNFSTKQEKSYFIMHENEYKKYGLKLRRRRSPSNLVDSWDDLVTYVYKNKKSWKQGTKRRNQYYK